MKLFIFVSLLQGFAIFVDEVFFHLKRGLPKWERVGHPIDTLTVVACLLFLYFTERTFANEIIYYVMAAISCICVTKDEWVHRKYCSAEEMWLHGVLFMLHPLVLFSGMAAWETAKPAFLGLAVGVFAFFVYEVVYWNFIWQKSSKVMHMQTRKRVDQNELYEYFGE
ncbi:hypothetical protein D3C72_1320710 [compost metagenome]